MALTAKIGSQIKLSQKQTIAPQVWQALSILQMNSQELSGYLETQTLENPLIELEWNNKEPDRHETLAKKLEWLSDNDMSNPNASSADPDSEPYPLQAASYDDESLQAVLLLQLSAIKLNPLIDKAARYIIQSLDNRGYLEASLYDLAKRVGLKPQWLTKALTVVQNMEPWGVGARDLKECLLIQVKQKGLTQPEVEQVIMDYLDELSRNRLDVIADQLGISIDQVKKTLAVIRALNPSPGLKYSAREPIPYLTADLTVIKTGDTLEVILNDSLYPAIRINPTYKNLIYAKDDQVRQYIENKLEHALLLTKHLMQRNKTLQAVSQAIVDYQKGFFVEGPGHLIPMTLSDLASRLKIHESTVSRAVNGKYLQCLWGTYELKYFFAVAVGSGALIDNTPENIKLRIKKIIKKEDPKKPLSDQKICNLLNVQGVQISRRTVAKYREEMRIPSTSERKEF